MPPAGRSIRPQSACGFEIRRGTGISHLFIDKSPPGSERRAYFTAKDIRYIQRLGLDHVRFPISEQLFWRDDGGIDHEMFALLGDMISAAIGAGLRAIVCLHTLLSHPRPYGLRRTGLVYAHPGRTNFPVSSKGGALPLFLHQAEVDVFCHHWRDLSEHLHRHPVSHLAYELFNEPFAPRDADWDRVWRAAYTVVRKREPERMLLIGSNLFQIPGTIKRLNLPVADNNILASFHLYYPTLFTHHRASWHVYRDYSGPIRYPGRPVPPDEIEKLPRPLQEAIKENNQPFSKSLLRQIVMDAAESSRKLGHGVCCGEFGCIDTVQGALRAAWCRDVVAMLEEHGIPWTQWDWKGNFGILDKHTWRLSGIHSPLGLRTPRWNRPPRPGLTLWRRLRRRLGAVAKRLGYRAHAQA